MLPAFLMLAQDMLFKYAVMVIIAVITHVSSEGLKEKSAALIIAVLSGVDSMRHEVIIIPDSTQNKIHALAGTSFDDGVVDIFTVYQNGAIVGFGLMDSVRSKSSSLPFLVITDNNGEIQSVALLSTPDPRSAKLRSRFWEKQFVGKKEIKARHIDAISGATISSGDITNGVIRLLLYLRILRTLI